MLRHAAIGLVVLWAGCFGPKSHDCAADGTSWVCPQELACAAPPTYCANPLEVNACDGKPEAAPCRTSTVPDGICVDNACQMCSPDIEGCRSVGWNAMTVPSDTYTVVYAPGSGDAWAGGAELVHYDGAHWEPDATFPMLPMGAAVVGITGTSSAHLFVAINGTTVYHQAAGAWTSASTALGLHAVWADGDDAAFAVGISGDVERFSGGAWTQLTTGTMKNLRAVWGTSASNVYAAGDGGTVIHYNGSTWTASTAGTTNLDAVWGSGPNDVYVAGASGIFHSTDGATWTLQGSTTNVTSIWGSSATDVFAGTASSGIYHSDGSGLWVPLVSPTVASSIAGSGPADVFAASSSQIVHYTGSCWSAPLAMAPASGYQSVWVASPSAVFAAGAVGALDRFDGAAWSHVADGSMDWTGVWARSSSDAFAVHGGNGGSQIDHWDGSAWSPEQNPTGEIAQAVAGTATATYAVATHVLTESAGVWTAVATTNDNALAAWAATDDGSVFFAGDSLSAYRGGTVDVLLAGSQGGGAWRALWGTSSGDVFAAGLGGQIRHFDGTSWSTPMDTGTTVDLLGLWGSSDDDVFAVGASGTILHYHAQLWSIVPPPAGLTSTLMSVGGSGSTIFVVGPGPTVARLIESAP